MKTSSQVDDVHLIGSETSNACSGLRSTLDALVEATIGNIVIRARRGRPLPIKCPDRDESVRFQDAVRR